MNKSGSKKGPPTPRQMDVLNFVRSFVSGKGHAPSIREIGEALHISSSSTVHWHLRVLQQKGYLVWPSSAARSLQLTNPPAQPVAPDVAAVLQGWLDGHGDVEATREILDRGLRKQEAA